MKITEKVKKLGSRIVGALAGVGVTASTAVTALAAEGASLSSEVQSYVQTGMNDASAGVGGILKIAIPIIIGVVVAVIVAKAGIGWLKNIGSKAK